MEKDIELSIPARDNDKLQKIMRNASSNQRLMTHLRAANVMAINRMGFSDHGPVHVKIVANIAVRLYRILEAKGVIASIVKDYEDYGFSNKDAEIVLYLSAIFHDIGMVLNREKHDELGMVFAYPLLDEILKSVYNETESVIMTSEIIHAIIMHDKNSKPLTIEAGILRIADGLDMEKGRARIPFEAGKINIHSVSAMAVDKVEINEGTEKPIELTINLSNPSGIFQVDELLKEKINISGLKEYFTVNVKVESGKNEIFKNYKL